jgi:hypothetical protein
MPSAVAWWGSSRLLIGAAYAAPDGLETVDPLLTMPSRRQLVATGGNGFG